MILIQSTSRQRFFIFLIVLVILNWLNFKLSILYESQYLWGPIYSYKFIINHYKCKKISICCYETWYVNSLISEIARIFFVLISMGLRKRKCIRGAMVVLKYVNNKGIKIFIRDNCNITHFKCVYETVLILLG